jgi:ferrochelatase
LKDKNANTIGIVLLNLGGPDSIQAVRPFLYNLFSDREIIRLGPPFLQKPIAWMISTGRSKKTEAMYRLIGGKSPILEITRAQADALEKALNENKGQKTKNNHPRGGMAGFDSKVRFKVYIGMRYWHPFINDTVRKIADDGIKHLIVLTLYPHYSRATTGSSISDFKKAVSGMDFMIEYIEQWPDYPPYIDALAELIAQGISSLQGKDFHLLYSAHSLPRSFIDEGDPYLDHIKLTIAKVNERLSQDPFNISGLKWHLSFQSKTGPVKWLEPSTEETLEVLSVKGCRDLFVVPVSFVSDHIETLYEIDILYKEFAKKHGIDLKRCRALNTSAQFILAMRDLIMSKIE